MKLNLNEDNKKKILIFALGGMGDLIMMTPSIATLKKNYPSSFLTVVIRNNKPQEIFKSNKYVDKVLCYPSNFIIDVWSKWFTSKNKIRDLLHLISEIRFLFDLRREKYDISLWAYPGETKRGAIISLISGARFKMGYIYDLFGLKMRFPYDYSIGYNPKLHVVEENLEFLKKIDCKKVVRIQIVNIPQKYDLFGKDFLKNKGVNGRSIIIGIHPGCDKRNSHKRWPIGNFVKLVERLTSNNRIAIIIFEGPDESGILKHFKQKGIIKAKNLKFYELAAIIKRCDLLITSDSGLGHIAAAFKMPTITLFGPANPLKTAPYGNRNVVITKMQPNIYLKQDADEEIKEKGIEALKKIKVEEVLMTVKKIFKNYKNEKSKI